MTYSIMLTNGRGIVSFLLTGENKKQCHLENHVRDPEHDMVSALQHAKFQ